MRILIEWISSSTEDHTGFTSPSFFWADDCASTGKHQLQLPEWLVVLIGRSPDLCEMSGARSSHDLCVIYISEHHRILKACCKLCNSKATVPQTHTSVIKL
jgi:hypothetical protein